MTLHISRPATLSLSIIIPAYNEADNIVATLMPLQEMRKYGREIIIVDGGSSDDTVLRARNLVDQVLVTTPGRAKQMNAGAMLARGKVLWFLHADTCAPECADRVVLDSLSENCTWGCFAVRLSGHHLLLRVIARMMNLRSCLTGIATGDQGIFMRRDAFDEVGGFSELPLMEDIEISRRLKRIRGRPVCLRVPLVTSSRRWEENGIVRTILLMWSLRLAFFLGMEPTRLARRYSRRKEIQL